MKKLHKLNEEETSLTITCLRTVLLLKKIDRSLRKAVEKLIEKFDR